MCVIIIELTIIITPHQRTHTHTLTHTSPPSHTHTPSHTNPLSLTHTPSLTYTHPHTHTPVILHPGAYSAWSASAQLPASASHKQTNKHTHRTLTSIHAYIHTRINLTKYTAYKIQMDATYTPLFLVYKPWHQQLKFAEYNLTQYGYILNTNILFTYKPKYTDINFTHIKTDVDITHVYQCFLIDNSKYIQKC